MTMTDAEKAEIEAHIGPERAAHLQWKEHIDEGFTQLIGSPACPLLDGVDCTVHPVRPYNCRRWGCFRTNTTQPHDVGSVKQRMMDRDTRRNAVLLQRRAQPWARAHGWEG